MKNGVIEMRSPEGIFSMEAIFYEEEDRRMFKKIYINWRELCNQLKDVGARSITMPHELAEGLYCIEMNAVRVKGNGALFDCYRLTDYKRIEIKASSILPPDLTSFGPKSTWDELCFMDFYRNGDWDGTFDIYSIENELITNQILNSRGETVKEQQAMGRRPRLSIFRDIIQRYNIKPIKTSSI